MLLLVEDSVYLSDKSLHELLRLSRSIQRVDSSFMHRTLGSTIYLKGLVPRTIEIQR